MNILLCGDIMGRSGREAVRQYVPNLRRQLALDLVVANVENAAAGYGLTEKLCLELFDCGVDVMTTGNHVWDQREVMPYLDREPRVLRPANFPPGAPGRGTYLYEFANGRSVLVVNLMGRLFMEALDCPFQRLDTILGDCRLGLEASAILVDMHAEASSEKMALAHHADGRVSAVVGTHTHVPTADHQVFPGGTGYMTDAGMCGDYDSVIGMQKAVMTRRFRLKVPEGKPQVAEGEGTLCAILIATDDVTGLARRVEPVRIGGRLVPQLPSP